MIEVLWQVYIDPIRTVSPVEKPEVGDGVNAESDVLHKLLQLLCRREVLQLVLPRLAAAHHRRHHASLPVVRLDRLVRRTRVLDVA